MEKWGGTTSCGLNYDEFETLPLFYPFTRPRRAILGYIVDPQDIWHLEKYLCSDVGLRDEMRSSEYQILDSSKLSFCKIEQFFLLIIWFKNPYY